MICTRHERITLCAIALLSLISSQVNAHPARRPEVLGGADGASRSTGARPGPGLLDGATSRSRVVDGADDADEPPVNPYLADSPWAMTHRNPYAQASSPYDGPTDGSGLQLDYLEGALVPITLTFSSPYADGRRVMWGSTGVQVFKADPNGAVLDVIDTQPRPVAENPISGAYVVLDRDQRFFVPRDARIDRYSDHIPGDPTSLIDLAGTFTIPDSELEDPDTEAIVGLNLTYDGYLAFVTSLGTVGVVSRDFTDAWYLRLSGDEEEVSNSIAVDENGGIYVVTSLRMYRVQWTGSSLSADPALGAWSAAYETGPVDPATGRLGAGSGSTPTLMGTGDQDRFVVITDGQELMHLVLFWRDDIPADWQPIAEGKDPRIAAEVPVTFGDPDATESISEQSVLVRGYGAVVVNNALGRASLSNGSLLAEFLLELFSNLPGNAPYGAEKFQWDPVNRTLSSVWVNTEVSLPNGVPTMSAASGLVYCVGQREGVWGLEALDWGSGASVFFTPAGRQEIYNSYYAATEVGPDLGVYSGVLGGEVRFRP